MSHEKLTRLKADTFRARLRLGLGFPGPVHVPEGLRISDSAVEALCDTLCVDGILNLSGCINLRALPDRLIVRGALKIDGCAKLTSLPPTVREVFGFSAAGCAELGSIASITECRGPLDLTGCDRLEPLAPSFRAIGQVKLSGCTLHHNFVTLSAHIPDTALLALPGRRLGDVLNHRHLPNHPVLEAVIKDADKHWRTDDAVLTGNFEALVKPRENK